VSAENQDFYLNTRDASGLWWGWVELGDSSWLPGEFGNTFGLDGNDNGNSPSISTTWTVSSIHFLSLAL
jgi:hypothetical protein